MVMIGLFGEVNEEMSANLHMALNEAAHQGDPVTVVLHTFGGDVHAGLAMYDMIRAFPYHTTTIALGPTMSAGALVLQAGKTRLASPNAQIMVHYGQEVAESHASAQQNKKLTSLLKGIMHRHSKVSKRTVDSWFRVDKYFSAEEAVKCGLVDGIEEPKES